MIQCEETLMHFLLRHQEKHNRTYLAIDPHQRTALHVGSRLLVDDIARVLRGQA